MSGVGQAAHTDTGFQAIDSVSYRHAPLSLSLKEAARDVVLYRIVD